jgi:uncharacterized RDD family membrane protein YckC
VLGKWKKGASVPPGTAEQHCARTFQSETESVGLDFPSNLHDDAAAFLTGMTWYYLTAGQPKGPIDVAELERLFQFGAVRLGTLIWRQGMSGWTSFADAFQRPAVKCSQCKQLVPQEPVIRYGTMTICPECKESFFAQIREGLAPDLKAIYGGFWIRFGAYLVDQVILFFLRIPFQIAWQIYSFSLMAGTTRANPYFPFGGAPATFWILYGIYALILFVISLAYNVLFVGKYGATPGKMALKLRIVRSDRSKLTYRRATARYFAQIVTGLTASLGYVMAAFDSEKRALHDYLCDTRVIKRNA